MHLRSSAVLLASLVLSAGSAAFAADLDYPYAPRARRPVIVERQAYPPEVYEAPPPRIYTRPVVGFYGYPYDYLERAPRDAYQPGPHPYMYAQPPGPVAPYGYARHPSPSGYVD
jgi:hypothetical protein